MNILKSAIHKFGKWYCSDMCRREFLSQSFCRMNERPIEFGFIFRQLMQTCPTKVLDVGTGTTALSHLMRNCGFLVTATDNVKDYWPSGMFNRHYHVLDDDITDTRIEGGFDFVSCVSVLEHIEAFDKAVACMFKLLRTGGHLAMTFPYSENKYIPNVYDLPDAGYGQDLPYICRVFSRCEIDAWLCDNRGKVVEQEYWRFWQGDFWTFGDQVLPPLQVGENDRHQLTCILLQKS